jgi:hypothetical protein
VAATGRIERNVTVPVGRSPISVFMQRVIDGLVQRHRPAFRPRRRERLFPKRSTGGGDAALAVGALGD